MTNEETAREIVGIEQTAEGRFLRIGKKRGPWGEATRINVCTSDPALLGGALRDEIVRALASAAERATAAARAKAFEEAAAQCATSHAGDCCHETAERNAEAIRALRADSAPSETERLADICPDPRCGKPLAKDDEAAHTAECDVNPDNDSKCWCFGKCWIEWNPHAHDGLVERRKR